MGPEPSRRGSKVAGGGCSGRSPASASPERWKVYALLVISLSAASYGTAAHGSISSSDVLRTGDRGATRSPATHAAAIQPKVACWNAAATQRVGFRVRPRTCGLLARSDNAGYYMIGTRWGTWRPSAARGSGTAYRLWPDVRVRLFAVRRRCGHRVFTRATVHQVGRPDSERIRTIALRICREPAAHG
jgi:hypothetical protein